MAKWYARGRETNSQALIIEEDTGRNVAVAYDQKDMHVLAAAPAALAALRLAVACWAANGIHDGLNREAYEAARAVLAEAEQD